MSRPVTDPCDLAGCARTLLAWQVQLYYILAELVSVYKAWYPGAGVHRGTPNLNRIQGPTAMPLEPLTKTDISLKFIYITCLRLILLATTHNGKWQTLKSQKFTETFKLVTQIFPTVETPSQLRQYEPTPAMPPTYHPCSPSCECLTLR